MVKETKFYDVLGVPPGADENAVKKAYRRLALKNHPDRGGDEAKFKEIGAAYDVLSDPERRKLYDQHGEKGLEQGGGGGGGVDASDIFSAFFGGGGRRRGEPKPKDIVHEMAVTLEEFYSGKTKRIGVSRNRLCAPCDGSGVDKGTGCSREDFQCPSCRGAGYRTVTQQIAPGFVQQMRMQCDRCSGSGFSVPATHVCKHCRGRRIVKDVVTLRVDVEKGMKRGDTVLLSGDGDQVPGVKQSGDVLIILAMKPHPFFQRRGRHLLFDYKVSLEQALGGFQLPIEHLDGRVLLLKTRPGQVLDPQKIWVIDREGMPVKGTGGAERGGMIVTLDVTFPDSLSAAQRQKLEAALGEPAPAQCDGPVTHCSLKEFVPRDPPPDERDRPRGGLQQAECAHQ